MSRIYSEKIDFEFDEEIYTVKEWDDVIKNGWIWNDCGCGYWVKDDMKSKDEVFSTPQLDATHVTWYSK
jgi:hypothetical protein